MRSPGKQMRSSLSALALAPIYMTLACLTAAPVFAQVPEAEPDTSSAPTPDGSYVADTPGIYGSLGLNLAAAIPFGEFSRNVSSGFGLTGDLSFRLVRAGWLGLRLTGGVIWYGYETIDGLVHVQGVPLDLETTIENYVAQGAIGPQVHFAGLPISARIYGLVGMSYFETRSSVKFDGDEMDGESVKLGSRGYLGDWTPSVALGGEVRWVFTGSRDGFLAGLGLNLEWRRHGTTRYLVKGSITQVDGQAVFEPLETRTDFLVISIGLWGGTW